MYAGEPVTIEMHVRQAADIAEGAGAPPALVAAALLHDIGHLLHDGGESCAERAPCSPVITRKRGRSHSSMSWRGRGIDARHEELGSRFLAPHFPPAVTEPVRLHVAAKRYLCRTDPKYFSRLSVASVRSLELQGGPMSEEEALAFAAVPFARDAVLVRGWDEAAKVPGRPTPDLEHFRELLESLCTSI